MTFLLDVNVLIALVDGSHVSHESAHRWFAAVGRRDWATCPITENGLVRIVANRKYPNAVATPGDALALLTRLVALPGHVFWSDDVSLGDTAVFESDGLATVGQVTDGYLLGLAVAHGGALATLDRRLSTFAVKGGAEALRLIDA